LAVRHFVAIVRWQFAAQSEGCLVVLEFHVQAAIRTDGLIVALTLMPLMY